MFVIAGWAAINAAESVTALRWLSFAIETVAVVIGTFSAATNKIHDLAKNAINTQTYGFQENAAIEVLKSPKPSKKQKNPTKKPPRQQK
jgi:hypothetical protein